MSGRRLRARSRGEAGESLVEVVATVAILGIAAAALVTGIGAATRFSSSDRQGAEALVVAGRAAEAVKAASVGSDCSTLSPSTYAAAVAGIGELPPGWSGANVTVTAAACAVVGGVSMPQVTVRATSPSGDRAASILVVPRW